MITAQTTIANDRAEIARVPQWVADFAGAHGVPAAIASDLNIALDEVLSNVVKYAYGDDQVHAIRIALRLTESALEAEVEDDGIAFDPLAFPSPDLDVSLASRKVGGLGIHFVRTLMSEVRYARVGGHNRLVLVKYLKAA